MAADNAEVRIEAESEEEGEEVEEHYSPRIRSPLARAMYSKMLSDRRHRGQDHPEWYAVDSSFYPDEIKTKFVQCYQDQGTLEFLENCYEKSDWLPTQLYHGFMKSLLTWFMSVTSANAGSGVTIACLHNSEFPRHLAADINAFWPTPKYCSFPFVLTRFLGRGSMFVFSKEQFRRLMKVDHTYRAESMIDLGAGDGKVTQIMAEHFNQVYATEVSSWMQSRLQGAGYTVLPIEEWSDRKYDLISCLNLLDRCERPLTLLDDIKRALKPGGHVVLALVLPYVPYVENVADHMPLEKLPITGRTFSEQALSLMTDLFIPRGFHVVSYTHLPYLCEGDMYRSFYILNDVVFVLKLVE